MLIPRKFIPLRTLGNRVKDYPTAMRYGAAFPAKPLWELCLESLVSKALASGASKRAEERPIRIIDGTTVPKPDAVTLKA